MPQMDLETLVCGGGDGKVACETQAGGGARSPPPEGDPYLPSKSFEAPPGWRNGRGLSYRVYDREESTKGITNPKSTQANPKSRSSSERFSATANPPSKPPIIGLPAKIRTSDYAGRCSRHPTQGRIFPKKGARGGGRKSAVPESEPGSPKVSCFGKVLSEKERARRLRELQWGAAEVRQPIGCRARLAAILGCRGSGGVEVTEPSVLLGGRSSPPPSRTAPAKTVTRASAETAEPPAGLGLGLGGMRRFSSGRRAASWGEEAELEARGRRSAEEE